MARCCGERDLNKLAAMKDRRVKKSVAQIALALEGDWRKEHLFALGQAFELYQIYQNKIAECDQQIEAAMRALERKTEPALQHKARKTPKAQATFELKTHLESICGVDLTAVPGLEVLSVQALISEIGLDMTRWKSDKEVLAVGCGSAPATVSAAANVPA